MSQHIEITGIIVHSGRGSFKVQVEDNEDVVVDAKLSGKMRQNKINIVEGDRVLVKVSVYDPSRGFIVRRLKNLSK